MIFSLTRLEFCKSFVFHFWHYFLLYFQKVQSRAREIYRARGYTDMKCSYGWFKRWSQRFHIQLRYSYDDELLEWILAKFDANTNVNHHDLQNHGLNLVRKEDPHFKAQCLKITLKSLIQHCERSEQHLHFQHTKVHF